MALSHVQKLMILLNRCSNMAQLKQVHAQVIVNGFDQSFGLVGRMICCVSSLSDNLTHALALFTAVHIPNVFLWNTLIKSYSKSTDPLAALLFYRHFCSSGLRPDHYTFPPLLQACKEASALGEGLQIQAHVFKIGLLESNTFTQTQLLLFLAECGCVASARRVFDRMCFQDGIAWTALISAYSSEHGDIDEAYRIFREMPLERDGVCWNAMISGFIRWGNIKAARQLFDEFRQKDVFTWTAIIGGYAQRGEYREALSLFNQMRLSCSKPNRITVVSALSSCAHLCALKAGMRIHEHIEKTGIYLDVYIGTTLVDMYTKCGNIENSLKLFNLMPQRDIYAWNTMIEGLAVHGLGERALELFWKMQKEEFKPNDVTFVGILTACSHMGLVNEGRAYFHRMTDEFGITPRIERYGCLVDLLGRAGFLEEAEEVVNTMPIQPNAIVWGALLGACRVGGNVELGEKALKQLLELEPQNGGNYILLSNIYAAASLWDDVKKVRKMMRDPIVEKIHGFSCIEVGGLVYEFTQGDKSLSGAVYALLDELATRLKDNASNRGDSA